MWVGGVWAGNGYTVIVPVQCPTPLKEDHAWRAGPASNLDTVSALLSCQNQKEEGEREPRRRRRDAAATEAALVEQFSRK